MSGRDWRRSPAEAEYEAPSRAVRNAPRTEPSGEGVEPDSLPIHRVESLRLGTRRRRSFEPAATHKRNWQAEDRGDCDPERSGRAAGHECPTPVAPVR